MLLLEQFEHLTLHPKNAARLKELVLQLAVQGKLTESWRNQNPHVEPASELLKRIEAEKAQLVKEKKIKAEKPRLPIKLADLPFDLPQSWTWCRLNDLAQYIQRGKSPSYVDESDVPVVSQKCVQWNGFHLDKAKFIEPSTLSKYGEERQLVLNDILWNSTGDGTVGRAALYPGTEKYKVVVADSHVTIVRLMEKGQLPFFIKYFIASPYVQDNLSEQVSGSTKQTELNTSTVKSFLVPLPPLAEQEAIVARVEEMMQKIEELEKANQDRIQLQKSLGAAALQALTAAPDDELEQQWAFLKQHFQTIFGQEANVKKLRETILQLAVQGKLTSAWRKQNPTTQSAADLLQQIHSEKSQLVKEKKIKKEKTLERISENEVPYELPESWAWCKIEDISVVGTGGTPLTSNNEYYDKGTVAWITSSSTGKDYVYVADTLITEKAILETNCKVYPIGTLIVAMYGQGKTRGQVTELKIEAATNQACAAIETWFAPLPLKDYTKLYFKKIYLEIREAASGGAQPNLNLQKVKATLISLPPLAEQEAIVAKVDQLMQLCDELEQQIKQANLETEALMQAVVQEALQPQEEPVLEE